MTTAPTITAEDRELAEEIAEFLDERDVNDINSIRRIIARHRSERKKRMDWYQDVYDFHEKFDCLINARPTLPPQEIADLRADMEYEESRELYEAVERGDLAGIADAIADLIYVLLGRAVSYGIDMRPVWAAVHAANMNKVGGKTRSDGKVMKPEGWEPPDIGGIIASQSQSGDRRPEGGAA